MLRRISLPSANMDSSSSSDSPMDDASMDDSDHEQEFEYGLDDAEDEDDVHEDYESDDDGALEDDSDDDIALTGVNSTLSSIINEFRHNHRDFSHRSRSSAVAAALTFMENSLSPESNEMESDPTIARLLVDTLSPNRFSDSFRITENGETLRFHSPYDGLPSRRRHQVLQTLFSLRSAQRDLAPPPTIHPHLQRPQSTTDSSLSRLNTRGLLQSLSNSSPLLNSLASASTPTTNDNAAAGTSSRNMRNNDSSPQVEFNSIAEPINATPNNIRVTMAMKHLQRLAAMVDPADESLNPSSSEDVSLKQSQGDQGKRHHTSPTVAAAIPAAQPLPSTSSRQDIHPSSSGASSSKPSVPAVQSKSLNEHSKDILSVEPIPSDAGPSKIQDPSADASLEALRRSGLMGSVDSRERRRLGDLNLPGYPRSRPLHERMVFRDRDRDRDREKISSSLLRRWTYDPPLSGGDNLPSIFDCDHTQRGGRPNGKTNPNLAVLPHVASESYEAVDDVAKKVVRRIEDMVADISHIDERLAEVERKETAKKEEEERKQKEKEEEEKEKEKGEEEEQETATAGAAPNDTLRLSDAAELVQAAGNPSPSSSPERDEINEHLSTPDSNEVDENEADQAENESIEHGSDSEWGDLMITNESSENQGAEEGSGPEEDTDEIAPQNADTSNADVAEGSVSEAAARRAAALGISLNAPANENPEVIQAATASTGIDPLYIAALPEDIRTEILTQRFEQIRTNAENRPDAERSAPTTTLNEDFLVALPPDLRTELLELEEQYQTRNNTNNASNGENGNSGENGQNNASSAPADTDPETFLATLAPELREEILLTSGESFIQSLPANLAAEARALRERENAGRLPWRVTRNYLSAFEFQRGPNSGPGRQGGGDRQRRRGQIRELPIYKWKKVSNGWIREIPNQSDEPMACLQLDGLSSLIDLLWQKNHHFGKSVLHQVLSHACKNTETRDLVLDLLIKLVTSDPSKIKKHEEGQFHESDCVRQHGTAVRRGLELLTVLCKYDGIVAEALLGLPRGIDELPTTKESEEVVELRPQEKGINLSTLVALLGSPLFVRSNTHLEQLIVIISSICQSIPPSKPNGSESSNGRVGTSGFRRYMGRLPPSVFDLQRNSLILDNEMRTVDIYDAGEDSGDDEEDSDDDFVHSSSIFRRHNGASREERKNEGSDEENKETVPVRFRIPHLREQELTSLTRVLLQSGCADKTYERVSRSIGLLGELPHNRSIFVASLVAVATASGNSIQEEYSKFIDSLQQSPEQQNRISVMSSLSAASASSDLTLLRVVKCLAALLRHEECKKKSENSEQEEDSQMDADNGLTSAQQMFEDTILHGMRTVWNALDKLLVLVSDETSAKEKKAKELSNLKAVVLGGDRNRGATRGLSPILARLSPMIEAFIVTHSTEETQVKKDEEPESPQVDHISASNSESAQSPAASLSRLSPISNSERPTTLDERLAMFVERHRGPINALLRANPTLLETSFKGTLRHAQAIDFDNKKAYFRNVIKRRSSESHVGSLNITVRRDRVLVDSYKQLRGKTPDEMKGRLHVQFAGEEGVDAGGVTREWYVILARQIFNPNYALFCRSAAKAATYQPDKRSYINKEHLESFRFVGRIIGKAIYDSQLIDAYFTRSFYKHILGLKPTYHDIEAEDPEYYKSLRWMLENDCTGIIDYTMSAEYDEFGEQKIIDLVPNGRNIPVTEENKEEYVRLVTEVRMTRAIEKQIEAFKEGFYELIPFDDCKIFNELELELLMSGLPDIDMADLKANVEYSGYTASSPQINWFWRCVSQMDQEDLARLVMFVTGTSKVPLEGFSMLQGMNGGQLFQIHRVSGDTLRLPSAHTCFNQLDLPEYSTAEILSERLLRAIRECNVGFGFA